MTRVECFWGISWDLQLREEDPFDEGASFVILQPVDYSPESINHAAHPGVGRPDHRQLGFRTAERRMNSVLL
jgi:hypothetical protein